MAQMAKFNHCEMCRNARGSEYCLDCKQCFCMNCKTAHLRIVVCKDHRFKSTSGSADVTVFCSDHEESYVFICDECDVAVCKVCAVTTHKGHPMGEIKEFVSKRKKHFLLKTKKLNQNENQKLLEAVEKEVDDNLKRLSSEEETVISAIIEDGIALKSMVDSILESLIDDVKEATAKEKQTLNQCKEEARLALKLTNDIRVTEAELNSTKDDVESLMKIKNVERKITEFDIPNVPVANVPKYRKSNINEDKLKRLMGTISVGGKNKRKPTRHQTISCEVFQSLLTQGTNFSKKIQRLGLDIAASGQLKDDSALIKFYRIQTMNELDKSLVPKIIEVFIEAQTQDLWRSIVFGVMNELNEIAPGLNLSRCRSRNQADIVVCRTFALPSESSIHCETHDTSDNYRPVISLCLSGTNHDPGLSTIVRIQLLYAIGFYHQAISLYHILALFPVTECLEEQQSTIRRFDPFSILLFGGSEADDKGVWDFIRSEGNGESNKTLSELDKVILNLCFPPCITGDYNPQVSRKTRLLYCGRKVMTDHNRPSISRTDGHCGLTDGANCTSCRTLIEPKNNKISEILAGGRWQGWSGEIYCGKKGCGPNYGKGGTCCAHLVG